MKIATASDVHIDNFSPFGGEPLHGLNKRGRLSLQAFRDSLQLAVSHGCKVYLINGDLFESSHPSVALLSAVAKILSEFSFKLKIIILPGNHDMVSEAPGNNSCSLFSALPNVIVPEKPSIVACGSANITCLPFKTGKPSEWVEAQLSSLGKQDRGILSLHMGLSTGYTPKALLKHGLSGAIAVADLKKLCKKYGYAACFLGDWHHPDDDISQNCTIVQLGTLCPSDFRYDHKGVGRLCVYDTESGELEEHYVPGPRFVTFAEGQDRFGILEELEQLEKRATAVAVRSKGSKEFQKEVASLSEAILGEKLLGTKHVFDTEASGRVISAGTKAALAKSSSEPVMEDYVNELSLGDISSEVVKRSMRYLNGTA